MLSSESKQSALAEVERRRKWTSESAEAGRWTFIATVLLQHRATFNPSGLLNAIDQECTEIGVKCQEGLITKGELNSSRDLFGRYRSIDLDVLINGIPISINYRLEKPDYNPENFNSLATDIFPKIKSIVNISEFSGKDGSFGTSLAYDRAAAVMLVANSVFRVSQPIAVNWLPAFNCAPAEFFQMSYLGLKGSLPPTQLWGRVLTVELDRGLVLYTNGLMALFGFELEALSAKLEWDDLNLLLQTTATQLLEGKFQLDSTGHAQFDLFGRSVDCRAEIRPSKALENTEVLSLFVEDHHD